MEIKPCLETLKSNVIRWYSFKENSKILVIGKDVKTMCDFLKENHTVFDVSEKDNRPDEKFDYIIVKNNISALSEHKDYLAEDGTILLLMKNRWGLEFFARTDGFKTVHENSEKLLIKDEIEKKLKEQGFNDYKFFYPLPNYNFANAIYSDNLLPKYNDSKLANNNIYLNNEDVVFDEIQMLRNFTKNGDFTKFTNSYLIEINPKSKEKAIFYNNIRKDEYGLITKIYDEYVEKERYNSLSTNHVNIIKENIEDLQKHGFNLLDKVENGKVISKYVTMSNLYEKVVSLIKTNKVEEAVSVINEKFNFIKEKFETSKVSKINMEYFEDLSPEGLFIVDKAYIDLAFENIFIDEKENMYIYDQEWVIENCPLEFLLFRIIFNMYMMNSEIGEIISRDDLLKRFNLFQYWEIFLKAETIFQENIVNREMRECYERNNKLEPILDRCKEIEKEYNDYKKHIGGSRILNFFKKHGFVKF